ncbi:hypothetical protein ABE218_08615 [Bacillus smithii]|uniref:hypothetical protein n=1 Tax=Bacillus smithii TaxID=1479 RepID=UPI003D21E60B
MEEKLKQIDEIFKAIDESLIEKVLEPKIGERIKNHYTVLKNAGIQGDDLVAALTSVAVAEAVRLSSFITAVLVSIDPNEPFDPRDFIHLVK